jgi:hypothetical protein
MPDWKYSAYPVAHAPGLESTQGLGLNIRDYVVEARQEDGGWTTVKRAMKQRKVRRTL